MRIHTQKSTGCRPGFPALLISICWKYYCYSSTKTFSRQGKPTSQQGFSKVEDPVERLVRVRSETPELASDVRDLMQIHQGEHHGVEHRQHLGHRREADTAAILP